MIYEYNTIYDILYLFRAKKNYFLVHGLYVLLYKPRKYNINLGI